MKKVLTISVVMFLIAAGFSFGGSVSKAQAGGNSLLEFNTMIGIPKAYTGTLSPIRGINGGGLPWVISSGRGELSSNGNLEVSVSGLVLDPNDPTVVSLGLADKNPVANFKAIVSCQSIGANGIADIVNVSTGLFPATIGLASAGGGDAQIEATISLPKPCIAPIVFVTSPGGAWFATTGN